jgi:diguanylate cyclase (GGDEF)-like protein
MPGNPFDGKVDFSLDGGVAGAGAPDEARQDDLYESATRDPLTQVANKRTFTEMLEREVAFATRHGRSLSLVMFDVDHFERVSETHGQAVGDYVLQRVADTVSAGVRTEDLVARVDGAEFAVLLRDIGMEGAFDCADRLRRLVLGTAFEQGGARLPITVSMGVAALEDGAPLTPDQLVARADACLRAAKQTGRNRVCSEVTGPSRPRAVGS